MRKDYVPGLVLTVCLCLVPLIIWSYIYPPSTINGLSSIMVNLGRIVGIVGLVLYSLNFIYATRLRFLERLFGGLNQVYIAHHVIGGLALIFLAFHPLFIAAQYVSISLYDAAMTLLPNSLVPLGALFDTSAAQHTLVLKQWAIFFGIIAFWGMVILLIATFFIKLPYKVWLFTHRFLGIAFFFAGLHVLLIGNSGTANNVLRIYLLALVLLGLLAFVYRLIGARVLVRRYSFMVDGVEVATPSTVHIYLTSDTVQFSFKPGQFIFVRFLNTNGAISEEWHPFTISSAPKDKKIRLSVKALGDYTSELKRLPKGTTAEVEGAYGSFLNSRGRYSRQVWIAGGIGITPFLSMIKSMEDFDYSVDLYYSVTSAEEMIDWKDLQDISRLSKNQFRIHPYVTSAENGYLTADYIENTSGNLSETDIYMCGPSGMVESLRKQFIDKQVNRLDIHTEEFSLR